MPSNTPILNFPYPLPTDRLADGATMIGNAMAAIEGNLILPDNSRSVEDPYTSYPRGGSVMGANDQALGWPTGTATILTFRRATGGAAGQIAIGNRTTVPPNIYMRNGNANGWSEWRVMAGPGTPDAEAAGAVSLTGVANGRVSVGIVFPADRFTGSAVVPRTVVSAQSTTPELVSVSPSAVTVEGFTLFMFRTTATPTTIFYQAVQNVG